MKLTCMILAMMAAIVAVCAGPVGLQPRCSFQGHIDDNCRGRKGDEKTLHQDSADCIQWHWMQSFTITCTTEIWFYEEWSGDHREQCKYKYMWAHYMLEPGCYNKIDISSYVNFVRAVWVPSEYGFGYKNLTTTGGKVKWWGWKKNPSYNHY